MNSVSCWNHGDCMIAFDPHPDDVDWWTGGLTLLLREVGWQVHYVCAGRTTDETRQQALESAKVLGVKRHFLDLQIIGNSGFCEQLHDATLTLLNILRPRMVFIQSPADYHQEHVILSRQLLPILRGCGRHGLEMPEIYMCDTHDAPEPVEISLDITDVWEKHMQSLRCHRVFEKPHLPGENALTQVKRGRAMVLGTSLPHPTTRVHYAKDYRMIWGNPKEV